MYGVVINNNKRLQFIIFCLSLSANIIFVILKYCDEMKRWLLVSALFFVAFCVQARGQKKPIKLHKDSIPWTVGLGSVDKVTEIRMNKGLIINPLNALNGQAAGVNISANGADRMAALSSVRVRGTTSVTGGNDPLVLIDGVSADLSTLSTIYPADIESFTILKNAAETAQFGSRGASGVIVVTTKKGGVGQFHIAYDGNIGVESVYKRIQMLRASEYVSTSKALGLAYNDGGFDTDFLRAVTQTGLVQTHHVAFGGGSDNSGYRASLGFLGHRTVIKTFRYNNFVAKLDLTQRAFDNRLLIELGVFGSSRQDKDIFDIQKLFYSAATQNPTFSTAMNASGGWDRNTEASQTAPPMALLRDKDDTRNLNFNTHLRLTFDVLPDLKALLFASYSFNSTERALFHPTWVAAQGEAYRGEHKSEDWLTNLTLTYNRIWGSHRLEATLLGEYQKARRTGFWTLVKGFTTNELGYNNLAAGALRPYGGTGSDYEDPSLGSVMGSLDYTLCGRYKLTVTGRADGSSLVGKHHTWGLFPSVSFEWDAKAEPWLRKASWLSLLKLRSGYGLSGNIGGIDAYYSMRALLPNGVVPLNGAPTVTMGITRNANPDLKWETRGTFNIGLDLGLMNNRIVMKAEYYTSKTWDMIYQYDVPVPPYTYDKLLANIGSMRNSGFELGIGLTPLSKKDMELTINVNLSWQKNRLISLSGSHNGTKLTASAITGIGTLTGAGFHGGNNNIVYQIVGQPLGVFYLPHCTGLVRNADGSYRYAIADLDGNGRINIEDGGDRYIAGQATPKFTLGSNIAFRYRAFDVSLQINGAFGHKIYNGTALSYMNMTSFPSYNVMREAPGQNIKDQTATDYWLESGDYLNFDYLTIGWNAPLKSKYISSLRVSCSVNNLATISAYSGLTPMINSYIFGPTLGIDDKRSYPVYRSYTVGLNIQF